MEKAENWDWIMDLCAFIDLETTGLITMYDPPPLILEAAILVTDRDLNELGRESVLVRQNELSMNLAMNPHAREMHEESGLMKALQGPFTKSLTEAERILCHLLRRYSRESDKPVVWGGCSPGVLDRPLVLRDMPKLYSMIHRRTLDASQCKLELLNWGGVREWDYEARHRAMSDCEDAVRLARRHRGVMQLGAKLIERDRRRRQRAKKIAKRAARLNAVLAQYAGPRTPSGRLISVA